MGVMVALVVFNFLIALNEQQTIFFMFFTPSVYDLKSVKALGSKGDTVFPPPVFALDYCVPGYF